MHLNTQLLFNKYAKPYFKNNMRVLEIGPDLSPSFFQINIKNDSIEWHTLNIGDDLSEKRSVLTYLSPNEYNYPIPDNSYDIILSANVAEHVKKLWTWFAELKRIVKKNGKIITIAPTSWPYHEAPVDCWRIYPEGINAIYEETGLINEFTTFESMETAIYNNQLYTPLLPGISTPQIKWKISLIRLYNRLISLLPHSTPIRAKITVAYDLISIATKTDE